MFKVTNSLVRRLFNSYGLPTIEVELEVNSSFIGRFIVPSGSSVGAYEVVEILDNNFDVIAVINNLNKVVFPKISGVEFNSPEEFDSFLCDLDGSKNKSKLGGNAIIGCSGAFWNAIAANDGLSLCQFLINSCGYEIGDPVPFINLINSGKHSDNGLAIQEFMVVVKNDISFADKILLASRINFRLRSISKSKNISLNVGKEGGISPAFSSTNQAMDLLLEAIGSDIKNVGISLDVAADSFYSDGSYYIDGQQLSDDQMIDFYKNLVDQYEIFSIEDPLSDSHPEGWVNLKEVIGSKILIVGDDLTVTNSSRIIENNKCVDCVIIKPNQIGTISETIMAVKTSHKLGLKTIFSHRSNDSEDITIAHLALGLGGYGVKFGGMSRSERLAKYNEIIRITN